MFLSVTNRDMKKIVCDIFIAIMALHVVARLQKCHQTIQRMDGGKKVLRSPKLGQQ